MSLLSAAQAMAFALIGLSISLAASAAVAGQSDCHGHAADIVRQAYPAATKTTDTMFDLAGTTITLQTDNSADNDPHALTCHVWPARPELTLVAVPLMTEQSDVSNEGDIELLVVDSAGFQVKQRLRLEGLMSDDAVHVSRITFDTAPYQIARGELAFGLRIGLEGSSGPNPFGETTLWLFSMDDHGLRTVLDNIVVDENHGEWDTACAGEFQATTRTLAIAPPSHAAFADLVVTEKTTSTVNKPEGNGECSSNDKTTTDKRRIRYEGSGYLVPKEFRRAE